MDPARFRRCRENGGSGDSLWLPAGPWLGLWRDGQGRVGGTEFEVRAGETTAVRFGNPAHPAARR